MQASLSAVRRRRPPNHRQNRRRGRACGADAHRQQRQGRAVGKTVFQTLRSDEKAKPCVFFVGVRFTCTSRKLCSVLMCCKSLIQIRKEMSYISEPLPLSPELHLGKEHVLPQEREPSSCQAAATPNRNSDLTSLRSWRLLAEHGTR